MFQDNIKILIFFLLLNIFALGQVDSLGLKKCIQNPDTYNGQIVYRSVDKMAEFKGGISEFLKYISKNINYGCREKYDKSVIHITFIIDTIGQVQNVCVITNKTDLNSDENKIKEAIEKAPIWTPAIYKDKKVCVRLNVPIRICLK